MHEHKDCTNLLLYSKSLSCEGGLWGIGPPGAVLQVLGRQEGTIFLFLLLVCVCRPWSHATLAHVVFIAQSQISNWQNHSVEKCFVRAATNHSSEHPSWEIWGLILSCLFGSN